MKRYLILAVCLVATQYMFSDLLYDIADGKYNARQLSEIQPMADGEHFAMLADSATIIRYSYKTGNVVDTLFQIEKIKNKPSFKSINGFEFSPNERLIMVYTNVQPRYRNSFTADYYLYNREKREVRPLSEYGSQELPVFSPDNRYIAFARENNLYMHKVDFNTEIPITTDGKKDSLSYGIPGWTYEEEFEQVRYYEWSPDSKMLAYVKFDLSFEPDFSYQLYKGKNTDPEDLLLYPRTVSYKYPLAGTINARARVYVYEDYYKNTRYVKVSEDDEDCYIPRIRWTSSAEQLAIFKLNRNQNKLDMYLANPKSAVATPVLTEEDKRYVDYKLIDFIQFLADNKGFTYVSGRDGYRHVYRYRMNGLLDRQLTAGNWDVTDVYGYDEKNNILYYQSAELSPLKRNVYSLDAKGRRTMLTDGIGMHRAMFNGNYSYFIDCATSLDMPEKYTITTAKGGAVKLLKDNSELAGSFKALNLPQKEFFTFRTSENIELNGWILKPQNFDASVKYPLLMIQYSGPGSQKVLDKWSIGWEYFLASQGYAVACVDGRGTGARGTEFLKCTYEQMGILETNDQIEAAGYLGKQSYIDKDRIGIFGWSYGGFVTLLAMNSDKKVFKAGISVAPVADWALYNTIYTERYMRRPQENFRGYEITSPLRNAEKHHGNLLIIHGTGDDNVHVQNTLLYTNRLVEAGKQFEMQLYTDAKHSISGKQVRRHMLMREWIFLSKNL